MRIKILGKYWNLRFVTNLGLNENGEEYLGHTDHPDTPNKAIKVKLGQSTEEEFDTILHECIHVLFPQADEDFVHQSSNDLTRLMFKRYDIKKKKE